MDVFYSMGFFFCLRKEEVSFMKVTNYTSGIFGGGLSAKYHVSELLLVRGISIHVAEFAVCVAHLASTPDHVKIIVRILFESSQQ